MTDYHLVIEAGKTERQYVKDLWRYRELFAFLAWREILIRYKQTVLGILWAIMRPLLTMLVFTFVFGKLAKFPSNGIPYPLLVFAGMLPWQFFSSSLQESGGSLIANANMISKVYFPRLVIPVSSVIVSLVDFLISFGILLVMMIFYPVSFSWNLLLLPFLLLIAFACSLGAGLWLSALSVKYRDFRYIIPFLLQFGLYISPVGFLSSVIPEKWRLLYSMNPMVGVIDGFRWALLGEKLSFYWPGFLISLLLVLFLFSTGLWYFRNTEKTFADVI
ncbi:MAG: ABC transporter permease [Candidatus Aureabacteria bacterium]|nr:ABC transporter permease [Candidatus Auribacterota bacterium]